MFYHWFTIDLPCFTYQKLMIFDGESPAPGGLGPQTPGMRALDQQIDGPGRPGFRVQDSQGTLW